VKYFRDEKFLKKLGGRIKALRQSQNMSQSQLAFEAEVPINQIGRIERGEINAGICTLNALAKAFGVEINELFSF